MSECPFLKYKQSKSCANCTGFICLAYGREKKLSDTVVCKGDYADCTRYIEASGIKPSAATIAPAPEAVVGVKVEAPALPPPKPLFVKHPCGCGEEIRLSRCPYQSTNPPPGMNPCTGLWCYANNKSVRIPKNCWNFQICTVYLMSKYKGVPFP